MKIALVGLYYDNNKGDPLMTYCTEHLYSQVAGELGIDVSFIYVDLFGRCGYEKKVITKRIDFLILKAIRKFIPIEACKAKIQNYLFKKDKTQYQYIKDYFVDKFSGADLIVVVGGALIKYKLIRDFHNPMHTLVEIAEQLNVPIYMQAMGIENSYDEKHESCLIVKDYLNSPIVKMITTRDDIEKLNLYVENKKDKIIGLTSDTAVWCPEIFDLENVDTSDVIGIGVIQPQRFVEYGQGVTAEEYQEWIYQLVNKINKLGVQWKLFSNGHIPDYEFGCKLLTRLGVGMEYIEPCPRDYKDLVYSISHFKMIVASRLHACIIAYGFNKQVIGIDWNDKDIFFGNIIGKPTHFFKPKDVTPEEAVQRIIDAMYESYDVLERNAYRNRVKEYIKESFNLVNV